MNIFRKLWMALGKPVRGIIREVIRTEVKRAVIEEVVPVITDKINEKLPGVGPLVGAVVANELGERFGIQPEIALHKGEIASRISGAPDVVDSLIERHLKLRGIPLNNFPDKDVK